MFFNLILAMLWIKNEFLKLVIKISIKISVNKNFFNIRRKLRELLNHN